MSWRVVAATGFTCARGLLAGPVWLAHTAALLALAGLSLLERPVSPQQAWMHASGLLLLAAWLPGLAIALRLRRAWPALGAGDPARDWVDRQAGSERLPRTGAMLGGIGALLVLQAAVAAGFGLMVSAVAPAPPFAAARSLQPAAADRLLARPGDFVELPLPARDADGEIRLRPRAVLGPHPTRDPLATEAVLMSAGGATIILGRIMFEEAGGTGLSLGRVVLGETGRTTSLSLPAGSAATLRLVRVDATGPILTFGSTDAWLVTTPLPAPAACGLLALRPLPWALALLLAALALAPFVSAGVAELALLGLGLPLAVVILGPEPPVQELLSLGLVVEETGAVLLGLAAAAAIVALSLLPRWRSIGA